MGADTGASRNEFPAPGADTRGQSVHCPVEGLPMDSMELSRGKGEVIVCGPVLSGGGPENRVVEVLFIEAGLFAAVDGDPPCFIKEAWVVARRV